MKQLVLKSNAKKGQATTELAILGAVVMMVLAYLLQQGYIYNSRQALEMYTFRKALELSRKEQKGISLTVIRDIITPSFFTGLNRQRLMASSSIEHNPHIMYIPYEEDPEHTPSRQLVQMDEAMIKNKIFFEVPPTKIKIEIRDSGEPPEWQWMGSAISGIDPQTKSVKLTERTSEYKNVTATSEDYYQKNIAKTLETKDVIPTQIEFDDEERIIENYTKDDWENEIIKVEVAKATIPKDLELTLEEKVRREKHVQTPISH